MNLALSGEVTHDYLTPVSKETHDYVTIDDFTVMIDLTLTTLNPKVILLRSHCS